MEKDAGDSRVLEMLGSMAKVLASALGRCGAKSCRRAIFEASLQCEQVQVEFLLFILTSVSFLLAYISEKDSESFYPQQHTIN